MVEAISRTETLGRGRRRRAGRFVAHLLAFLLPVFLPIAAGAQTPEARESERTRAARVLLNRMNVSRLSGVISSPFFGLPIRARDAREISLEMRFDF